MVTTRSQSQKEAPVGSCKYSVILPTYNERDNLPLTTWMLVKTFHDNNLDFEIVVVEDSSPDGTLEVAQHLQAIYGKDKLRILSRPGKMGLGTAYVDGLRIITGSHVVLMDADMSHHPRHIPEFIKLMEVRGHDVVSGTRYSLGGGVAGWDLFRKLTSRVANFLAHTLLSPGVTDLTGSFRLFTKKALEDIIKDVTSKGYVFQMEVILRARLKGYSVGEVPIKFVDRIYGESKLGSSEIVGYLMGLLKLFFTT
ncbi:unnamed protein product [Discosporangium mesarthrocarpum]